MSIRQDFPILHRQINDKSLVYLDNAATTQKPQVVIDAIASYYQLHNSNVHRAAHTLAAEATELLENARTATANFLGATDRKEIVFTRGTTEAINLVANCLTGELQSGDEILITCMEHHSNIVPWQMLAQRTGATLRAVDVTATGELDLADFTDKLNKSTKVLALNHVSNALGTVNPVATLIQQARAVCGNEVAILLDGAQAALHETLNVSELDCDFYTISGHKMYAPTGIGALYGKLQWLERLPPWHGGGEMIEHVSIEASTYQAPPFKFEAGTPNIAGAVGLGAAIDYLQKIDRDQLTTTEDQLVARAISQLRQIPGVTIIGDPAQRRAVVSFLIDGLHPHDAGTLLDQQNVAVRTGHHCTMPLMQTLNIPGTIRASFSLYSNSEDVDQLVAGVNKLTEFI